MAPLSVRFPNSRRYAPVARRIFENFVRACCVLSEHELQELRIAVGEAVANAVEHGYREKTYFELRCSIQADAIVIEVEDDGPGFGKGKVMRLERDLGTRGRGMTLMRGVVDRIEILKNGRLLRLRKSLRAVQTVATAAGGEPTAPGKRSGGAVSKKR